MAFWAANTYSTAGTYTVTVTVTNSDETGSGTGAAVIADSSLTALESDPNITVSVTSFEVQQGQLFFGNRREFQRQRRRQQLVSVLWIYGMDRLG